MTDAIPSWISSDNKIHTDYLTYLKHDLTLWLTKVTGNEVDSKKIVAAFDKTTIDVVLEQITAIREQIMNPATFTIVRTTNSVENPQEEQ